MNTYPCGTKNCATCAHWGGCRTLKHSGSYVEVKSAGDRGNCYAGTFSGVTGGTTAMYCCAKYQKWSALR